MIIAAHLTVNKHSTPSFLSECLGRLALQYPDDHFIFFTDEDAGETPALINCTYVLISPKIKNSLLLHYWYNYKLPSLLKRYNANVFISENGMLSIRSNKPQMMVIKNTFFTKKKLIPGIHSRYLEKFFLPFLKKATAVITTEKYIEDMLAAKYSFAADKILSIYPGLSRNYQPISWQQKEEITAAHADEKDFFIYPVSANTKNNIIYVLKAFSQFKKWQKSNMQLLLLLQHIPGENLIKDFGLYKYRNEVKIIKQQDDKQAARIIAAAYALIYLPAEERIAYPCLHAMQCEVPVITTAGNLNKSMYEDAAIYASTNEKIIAEKMMLVYKDENLRNDCIKKGLLQTGKYNWDTSTRLFWQAIIKNSEQ
ncbi:MAG: glycosyltransferase [Ferruginibacter sp.]